MSVDPTPVSLPIASGQAIKLLVGLKIEDRAAGTPRLAAGALWVRHLCPALDRAGLDPGAFERLLVLVTAVYPAEGDPSAPPDPSISDFEPGFPAYVISAFEDSPWEGRVGSVEVREQWRPEATFHLDIGIYGIRGSPDVVE